MSSDGSIVRKIASLILLAIYSLFCSHPSGSEAAEASKSSSVVRHYVAFKFKDGTPETKKAQIIAAFKNLRTEIPNVTSVEEGINISPENFNKGMTNGFIVTFPTVKDRDVYLAHPNHTKFKELATPFIADIFVLDFVTNTASVPPTSHKSAAPQPKPSTH